MPNKFTRTYVAVVGSILWLTSVSGAGQPKALKPIKDDPKVLALLRQVESLPIEFRADIELSAIESGKVLNIERQRRLLEGLFQNAQFAHDPFKLRNVMKVADLRATKIATAHTLNLDGTSIRTRALASLMKFDNAEAKRLWSDMQLSVPASQCSSPFVYDLSGYYDAMRELLSKGFTGAELAAGAQVDLLQQEIEHASSPMQLDPLALLSTEVGQTDEQLSRTVFLYSTLLHRLEASDRELGAISASLPPALMSFTAFIRQRRQDSSSVVGAYRAFLVRNATAGACSDQPANREELAQGFANLVSTARIESAPLSAKDLKPKNTEGTLEADHIPDGTEFEGMLRPLMALQEARGADASLAFPNAESEALQFLAKIDAINTSSTSCHACVFHEKADFYLILLEFAPSKEIGERVANRLVRFLAADPMEQEAPLEWLFRVKLLLNLTRKADESQLHRIEDFEKRGLHLSMLPSDSRTEILQAIGLAGNEVMSDYEHADEVLRIGYVLPPV